MTLTPSRIDALLFASALGLGSGALAVGQGSILSLFALVPCGLFGAAMVAWRRDPSSSMAALVLISAGFVRILLGPSGLGALLLVPLVARRADPEHAKHLIGAAVGIHVGVFLAQQLATALGEGFPTLAPLQPGQVLAGLALFVPFTLLSPVAAPTEDAPPRPDPADPSGA